MRSGQSGACSQVPQDLALTIGRAPRFLGQSSLVRTFPSTRHFWNLIGPKFLHPWHDKSPQQPLETGNPWEFFSVQASFPFLEPSQDLPSVSATASGGGQ